MNPGSLTPERTLSTATPPASHWLPGTAGVTAPHPQVRKPRLRHKTSSWWHKWPEAMLKPELGLWASKARPCSFPGWGLDSIESLGGRRGTGSCGNGPPWLYSNKVPRTSGTTDHVLKSCRAVTLASPEARCCCEWHGNIFLGEVRVAGGRTQGGPACPTGKDLTLAACIDAIPRRQPVSWNSNFDLEFICSSILPFIHKYPQNVSFVPGTLPQ